MTLTRLFAAAVALGLPGLATAIDEIDLSTYELTATYFLPPGDFTTNPAIINAHEASAVTYNWDTDTLFVIGDEGGEIVEVSKEGVELSQMIVIGFNDPEGLTYIGNGKLVLVEERNRDAYEVSYNPGGFLLKNAADAIDLGTFVDNIGLEGISYDPRDGTFITVKEKTPQEVNVNTLDFTTNTAVITPLFVPALGVADIADVAVLATVPSLAGKPDEDHLLIFSQESEVLLEVDRAGNVLGQFDFSAYADSAEGVTIDPEGNIYIVAENGADPQLFVLSPPAAPASAAVPAMSVPALGALAAGVVLAGARRARRLTHARS